MAIFFFKQKTSRSKRRSFADCLLHQTPIPRAQTCHKPKTPAAKCTSPQTSTKRDPTAHPCTCLPLSTSAPRLCAPAPWFKLCFCSSCCSSSQGHQVRAWGPALYAGEMEQHKASHICNLPLNMLASLISRDPTNPEESTTSDPRRDRHHSNWGHPDRFRRTTQSYFSSYIDWVDVDILFPQTTILCPLPCFARKFRQARTSPHRHLQSIRSPALDLFSACKYWQIPTLLHPFSDTKRREQKDLLPFFQHRN